MHHGKTLGSFPRPTAPKEGTCSGACSSLTLLGGRCLGPFSGSSSRSWPTHGGGSGAAQAGFGPPELPGRWCGARRLATHQAAAVPRTTNDHSPRLEPVVPALRLEGDRQPARSGDLKKPLAPPAARVVSTELLRRRWGRASRGAALTAAPAGQRARPPGAGTQPHHEARTGERGPAAGGGEPQPGCAQPGAAWPRRAPAPPGGGTRSRGPAASRSGSRTAASAVPRMHLC